MSETSPEITESTPSPPPAEVAVKKPEGTEASLPKIRNLPKKVERLTNKVESSPNVQSNQALADRLNNLEVQRKIALASLDADRTEYMAKYGADAVRKAELKLNELSARIQEIEGQRAASIRVKAIDELQEMGYSR